MNRPAIWKFFGDKYNVYCPNKRIKDQVMKITSAEERGIYFMPNRSRAYDVLISERFRGRVMKILNIKRISQ